MIFRAKQKNNFTIIPNKTINDEKLSLRSKGLLLYLLSKPDNWNVSLEQLASVCSEGRGALRGSINELLAAGYLERKQIRDDKGHMSGYNYNVYDHAKSTVVQLSDDGKPLDGKPSTGNRTLISTVSNKNIETRSNTNVLLEAKPPGNEEINQIVTGFNRTFNVDHKQDRRYAQHFRRKFGVEVTLAMFAKAAEAQSHDKYCPRTPTLKDFWYQIPKLQDYFRRQTQTTGITEITF